MAVGPVGTLVLGKPVGGDDDVGDDREDVAEEGDAPVANAEVMGSDCTVYMCGRIGIHYGIVALLLSAAVHLCSSPGHSFGVAPFVDHWIVDLRVSRGEVSLFWAIATFVCGPLLPFAGATVDRFGVAGTLRRTLPLFGLVLVWMSSLSHKWELSPAIIANRLINADVLPLLAVLNVNKWFVVHRGKAAVLFNFMGTLHSSFPAFATSLIASYGWRGAYARVSALQFSMLLPAAIFLRNSPEVCGLRPDLQRGGDAELEVPRGCLSCRRAGDGESEDNTSWEPSEVFRSFGFWTLIAGVMANCGWTAFAFHMMDICHSFGLPKHAGPSIFIAVSFASLVTGFLTGFFVIDQLREPHRLLAVSNVLNGTALSLVLSMPQHFIAWAIVFGCGNGCSSTVIQVVFAKYFGQAHMGRIQGTVSGAALLMSGIGPLGFGLLSDLLGGVRGYRAAVACFLAANCTTSFAIAVMKRPSRPPSKSSATAPTDVVGSSVCVGAEAGDSRVEEEIAELLEDSGSP
eukprot:gnl/TRDRNA2_/TRDRNA2_203006_c0_seq1.p1 gnl/TRDRNA2_/TRDRNA2_203006_c0~~gnl/TRDRNA2_/TRDRNA2_203006_c0_seq1.p1  ORF type:complete len:515 (-),score=62.36 gnl/TRDRNA2_/TRDRNA2_203006_c0_seq1:5-1549(-)